MAEGTYMLSAGCAGTAAIVAAALDEMSAAELHALLDREEQVCTALTSLLHMTTDHAAACQVSECHITVSPS